MTTTDSGILEYATREAAKHKADEMNRVQRNTGYGCPVLDHGQVSPDYYSARKLRGVESYGVWIKTSYYGDVSYAPKSRWMRHSG